MCRINEIALPPATGRCCRLAGRWLVFGQWALPNVGRRTGRRCEPDTKQAAKPVFQIPTAGLQLGAGSWQKRHPFLGGCVAPVCCGTRTTRTRRRMAIRIRSSTTFPRTSRILRGADPVLAIRPSPTSKVGKSLTRPILAPPRRSAEGRFR